MAYPKDSVSPAFQFQVSEVGKALVGQTLYDLWQGYPTTGQQTPHGTVTAATLPEFLVAIGVGNQLSKRHATRLANRLGAIVGGHHGFFPSSADIEALSKDDVGRGEWFKFRLSIFEQLQGFVELTSEDLPKKQCDNAAAMILAGLTTISDWIASNSDPDSGFPYVDDTPFEEYAKGLRGKASNALRKQGWQQPTDGKRLAFTELFSFITEPSPLQKAAIQLSETLEPPCLVIVEASMGEGKTEAALYLADHLQHQAGGGGFYIGLPTQATSNAMFKRVKEFLSQRYRDDVVNLTLSHSAAALQADYQSTVCRLDQVYDQEGRGVVTSEWHTVRKRTLLSPYGVGTLDQGLMGVVRSRHQFVRLFGLAGRTIILDEIHAYDLYTSTLLERFLEWAAVLGSPVIALSATLPASTRQGLLNAYAGNSDSSLPLAEYPRITALTPSGATAQHFQASNHVQRSLLLRWIKDEEWGKALQEVLAEGGCAAVICSTVNRAQKIFQRLQPLFAEDELGLFHGRFLFRDRERIEKDCLEKFGKGNAHRPDRFVLVATQVIEQSLDVDFDLMISDMAPIDLLLQRSGRLHRHTRALRPSLLKKPSLWIVEPTLDSKGKAQFGESKHIYDRHVLLRTWLSLRHRGSVQLPEETDDLIESVYHLDMPIPEALESCHAEDWQVSLDKYHSEEKERKRAIANKVKVPPPKSDIDLEQFTWQHKEDDESAIAATTRLGKPSVSTIFLQRTETGLVLPGTKTQVNLQETPDLNQIRELLAHSTRLSNQDVVTALLAQKNPSTWTSALLRNCRYVELNAQARAQVGKWELYLDAQQGIVINAI